MIRDVILLNSVVQVSDGTSLSKYDIGTVLRIMLCVSVYMFTCF